MLAEELGASVIPVRETLRQLEAEGLIRITPRRGATVVKMSHDEIRDVYKVRAVVEAFATKEAVLALGAGDIKELQRLSDELKRKAKTTDDTWSKLNRTWHLRLYEAAGSPLLLQIIGSLWDRCTLTSHSYARDPGHRLVSVSEHEQILSAVRQRNGDLAAQIVAQHVHSAMVDLLRREQTPVSGVPGEAIAALQAGSSS
jgi:DNA-binding GntR family transcriptional regulator